MNYTDSEMREHAELQEEIERVEKEMTELRAIHERLIKMESEARAILDAGKGEGAGYRGPGLKMPPCDWEGCNKLSVNYVPSIDEPTYSRCEEHDTRRSRDE